MVKGEAGRQVRGEEGAPSTQAKAPYHLRDHLKAAIYDSRFLETAGVGQKGEGEGEGEGGGHPLLVHRSHP